MQEQQSFRVQATITLADNSAMEVPLDVFAVDSDHARRMVTREHVLSVSDDWGRPIRNVTVRSVLAIRRVSKLLNSTA